MDIGAGKHLYQPNEEVEEPSPKRRRGLSQAVKHILDDEENRSKTPLIMCAALRRQGIAV